MIQDLVKLLEAINQTTSKGLIALALVVILVAVIRIRI